MVAGGEGVAIVCRRPACRSCGGAGAREQAGPGRSRPGPGRAPLPEQGHTAKFTGSIRAPCATSNCARTASIASSMAAMNTPMTAVVLYPVRW
jgi:hypothetical protein